jgi:hypothetical protein
MQEKCGELNNFTKIGEVQSTSIVGDMLIIDHNFPCAIIFQSLARVDFATQFVITGAFIS